MSRAKAPLSSTMANQNGSCSSPLPTGMQLQQTGRWRGKSGNKTTVSIGTYVQQSSVSWANRPGDCSFRGIPSEAPCSSTNTDSSALGSCTTLNAGHFEFHCHQICCLNVQLLTCCFFAQSSNEHCSVMLLCVQHKRECKIKPTLAARNDNAALTLATK